MRLKTKRMGRHWWIVGDEDAGPYGPYASKAEADEDRRGVQETFRNWGDREYATGTVQGEDG